MENSSTQSSLQILSDKNRLNGVIDSMARCMARVMTIQDYQLLPTVKWDVVAARSMNKVQIAKAREEYWKRVSTMESRTIRFGNLLFEEFAVKTTPVQERRLRCLYEMQEFAQLTCRLCRSMMEESDESYEGDSYSDLDSDSEDGEEEPEWKRELKSAEFRANIDLWYYAYSLTNSPFFLRYGYTKTNGSQIPVGGVSRSLCQEFHRLCIDWLKKCDKVFCQANEIEFLDCPEMDNYIADLSIAIARRHSLMRHPTDTIDCERHVDVVMEPTALDLKAVAAFWDNHAAAEHDRGLDTDALKALLIIARQGGHTHAAKDVIMNKADSLRRALDRPAQELALHVDKRLKKFNFAALRKVVDSDSETPFMCRCECAHSWYENHGEWAAAEIQTALDYLHRDDIRAGTRYLIVTGTERTKDCLELPPNPCAFEELNWFAYRPDYTKRSRLSNAGMRIVCMSTFLRMRVQSKTLKFGTSNPQIVNNIARDLMHNAAYACAMVESERLQSNQGVALRLFELAIQDPSSEVSEKLDVPFCELGGISFEEINTVFGTPAVFDQVKRHLSSRTRKLISPSTVPEQYIRFTDDAMTMLLDSINLRRISQGLNSFVRPDTLACMLRCLPKVKQWQSIPVQNRPFLALTIEDLKLSHPSLRSTLESMTTKQGRSGQDTLCWKETGAGGHQKLHFIFDDVRLTELLAR